MALTIHLQTISYSVFLVRDFLRKILRILPRFSTFSLSNLSRLVSQSFLSYFLNLTLLYVLSNSPLHLSMHAGFGTSCIFLAYHNLLFLQTIVQIQCSWIESFLVISFFLFSQSTSSLYILRLRKSSSLYRLLLEFFLFQFLLLLSTYSCFFSTIP